MYFPCLVKPGTRWYGKTKQGKYMTEADAQKAGYRAAEKEGPLGNVKRRTHNGQNLENAIYGGAHCDARDFHCGIPPGSASSREVCYRGFEGRAKGPG